MGTERDSEGETEEKRVVRHLFFFLLLPLKIALPPDCTDLRFQGNSVHSQLSSVVERKICGGSGCEVLISSSSQSPLMLSQLVSI